MKSIKITWILACVLIVALSAGHAFAAKKVVVVFGVSEAGSKNVGSYDVLLQGINEVLKASGVETEVQYADLTPTDPAVKEQVAEVAASEIRAKKPDAVITLADDSTQWVGGKINDIPLVFTFVFGSPDALGMKKPNATGVLRRSYAADIWGLAHKLLGAKTVGMMSKNSLAMSNVRKYIFAGADKLEAASGVRFKEMYLVETFDEWKNQVNAIQEDFIYLADTSRLTDGDRSVPRGETVAWTVANSKKPVVAADANDVKSGGLYSIITSERDMGQLAAEQALKILNGAKPADVPYVTSKKGKLLVNMKTAQQYNLEIPYDILSTAEEVFE